MISLKKLSGKNLEIGYNMQIRDFKIPHYRYTTICKN